MVFSLLLYFMVVVVFFFDGFHTVAVGVRVRVPIQCPYVNIIEDSVLRTPTASDCGPPGRPHAVG